MEDVTLFKIYSTGLIVLLLSNKYLALAPTTCFIKCVWQFVNIKNIKKNNGSQRKNVGTVSQNSTRISKAVL